MSSKEPEIAVIGAGFGRTGTSSLKIALAQLGFGPCNHMTEVVKDTARCLGFIRAYHGKPTDWRSLMRAWGATVDDPTSDFVPELMAAYPNAKVVLTVRDSAEAWWASFQSTIARFDSPLSGLLVFSIPQFFIAWRLGREVRAFRRRTYGSHDAQGYEKHNARMIALVAKERMLVYNVKEGWAPLCEFLGVPVPEGPFPRTNETKDMIRIMWTIRAVGAAAWTLELGLIALLIRQSIRGGWWRMLDVRRFVGEL
ncbi:TPR repeat-containing protein-like protein [Dacryopinax primogenitus]|uniref:TPR repeat-containing protein-like protein n=1 Tax=Dacryopinax primogenitus (strain DJM 731) TaxID=1858805 RepID=M5GGC1_DACPD|nr:TPR repeat-containing protein-like protein [Dacryopinax primogenitus]EJU05228.1 TPR repeat-containing protein-like protein [Dacryopinax primogenitus]